MAPEQAEGLPVTPAVDVFALGALAAYAAARADCRSAPGNDAAMLYRIAAPAAGPGRLPALGCVI